MATGMDERVHRGETQTRIENCELDLDVLILHEIDNLSEGCDREGIDAWLRRLLYYFAGDASLDRALELLSKGKINVTRVLSPDRTQECFFVASLSTFKFTAEEIAQKATGMRRYGDAWVYTVLLSGPGFCSCMDFANRVIAGGPPHASSVSTLIPVPFKLDARGYSMLTNHGETGSRVRGPTVDAEAGGRADSPRISKAPYTEHRRFCKHILAARMARALGSAYYTPKQTTTSSEWRYLLQHV